ncbi:2241_t:CDS:2, partial [Racocetra fulgida]
LSHQAAELLRELQQEYLISGGGIQSSVKTLIKDVANIINSRGFFDDIECLARIICLAKEAVKAVECKSTTLADVYIKLVQLASAIHHIPLETEHREFRRICIQIYNPKAAVNLWKSLGGGDISAKILLTQMKNYREFVKPYNDYWVDNTNTLTILDATLSMGLKDEDDENDIYSIDEIEEELFILEENQYDTISVESELLLIGNTMDLDSSNFKLQPLDNDSSEIIEDHIEEDHGNKEFDVDAL